jgi:CRP-like cAMP-binding protein
MTKKEQHTQLPFIKNMDFPVLESQGKMSKNIYFIISGQIYIMDETGWYEYGIMQDGGFFGDISCMLDTLNEFNYMYNPYSSKPVLLLSIPCDKFMRILESFPSVKHKFKELA